MSDYNPFRTASRSSSGNSFIYQSPAIAPLTPQLDEDEQDREDSIPLAYTKNPFRSEMTFNARPKQPVHRSASSTMDVFNESDEALSDSDQEEEINEQQDIHPSYRDGVSQDEKTPYYDELDLVALITTGSLADECSYELKFKDKLRRANVLNPEPPQFAKIPRLVDNLGEPFDTMVLYALKEQMGHGFPGLYPRVFKSHSISKEDWVRFIEDICHVQIKLSTMQRVRLGAIMALNQGTGAAVSQRLRRRMGKARNLDAQSTVDVWNARFFNQRKVHIVMQTPEDLRARRFDVPDTVLKGQTTRESIRFGSNQRERCRLLIFSTNQLSTPERS